MEIKLLLVIEWVAVFLVLVQIYLMSEKRYMVGWWVLLAACVLWAYVGINSNLWGLFWQQIVIFGMGIRALWKLR